MAIEPTTGTATGAAWTGASTPSSTASPQAVSSATLLSALTSGATLEARLLAVLADGTAKLATRLGTVTAKTEEGSILPAVGTPMTLRVDARAATDGEPLILARPSADHAVVAAARPDAAERGPAEIVGRAVASALARQEGLGASLRAVEALFSDGARLPPAIAAAAGQLLKARLPLDKPISAKALAAAMRTSGIFLETDLARAEAPVEGDVKAALLALKSALNGTAATPQAAQSTKADGAGQAAPPPLPSAAPAPTLAATPAITAQTAPPAGQTLPPSTLPPTPAASAPVPGQTSAPQPAPAAQSSLPSVAAPPAPAPAAPSPLNAAAGLLGLQEMTAMPARPADPLAEFARAATPPLRGTWPEPEATPDRPAPGQAPTDAAATLARARDGTEAALARLVLDQVASLADDGASERVRLVVGGQGERSGPQWTFDVPFQLEGRTGSLRFQVERDGGERRDGRSERKQQSWRLRLAFAVEPLGAIRAQVGLVGERVAVGIWAERPATVAALSAHAGELRDALVAAAFEVDEIHLAAGVPPDAHRRAPGSRAMLDATA